MTFRDRRRGWRTFVAILVGLSSVLVAFGLWFFLGDWGFVRWPGWYVPVTMSANVRKSTNNINYGYLIETPRWSEAGYTITIFARTTGGFQDDEARFKLKVLGTYQKMRTRQWLAEGQVLLLEVESKSFGDSAMDNQGTFLDTVGILYNFETGELRDCSTSVNIFHVAPEKSRQSPSFSCFELEDYVKATFGYTSPPMTRIQNQ